MAKLDYYQSLDEKRASFIPGESPWYYLAIVAVNLLFVVIGASGQISVDRARHRVSSGGAPVK